MLFQNISFSNLGLDLAKKREEAAEKTQRKQQQKLKLRDKVAEALEKERGGEQLNVADLRALCSWKKKADDASLGKTREELLAQYEERKHRREPLFPTTDSLTDNITPSIEETTDSTIPNVKVDDGEMEIAAL